MQNTNNHPTETSSLKPTFIENSVQHIDYQVVTIQIDKTNGNVGFICKHLSIELIIKQLRTGPDIVLNNSVAILFLTLMKL